MLTELEVNFYDYFFDPGMFSAISYLSPAPTVDKDKYEVDFEKYRKDN